MYTLKFKIRDLPGDANDCQLIDLKQVNMHKFYVAIIAQHTHTMNIDYTVNIP